MHEEIIAGAVEDVSRAVLEALASGGVPTADALRLLLRGYAATGRDDFRVALESGLADAIDIAADSSSESSPAWLVLFAEAADASDDQRVRDAASNLASKARMIWGATRSVGRAARSVDACLRANLDVPAAIDELERIVSAAYEPGDGIDGAVDDEVSVAGALLTAFAVTGRLPYAMLAEELVQHARPQLMSSREPQFALACEGAALLARMAVLHRDDDYCRAAVISPGADYAADAAALLERLAAGARARGLAGAGYALAAGELQSAIP